MAGDIFVALEGERALPRGTLVKVRDAWNPGLSIVLGVVLEGGILHDVRGKYRVVLSCGEVVLRNGFEVEEVVL